MSKRLKEPARGGKRPVWGLCSIVSFLFIHAGLLAWSASSHSPTRDEAAHLPAGLAVWRFGRTDLYRVNPPLVRTWAAMPLLWTSHEEDWRSYNPSSPVRHEWGVGTDFITANGRRSQWLFTIARWFCIPFSLVGLWLCWRWGCELTDERGGLTAAALWCFCPNIIGHGSLITPDIPATVFGLLAAWRFHRWGNDRTWRNAFLCGLSLGVALLTKSTWIILLPLWTVMGLVVLWLTPQSPRCSFVPLPLRERRGRRDRYRPQRGQGEGTAREKVETPPPDEQRHPAWGSGVLQLVVMLGIGVNLLNLGYGFHGTGQLLKNHQFFSRALSGETRDPRYDSPGNRFQKSWLGELPVPFPVDFVSGIDLQKLDFEGEYWNYLLGEHRRKGWWSYYLIGLFAKVPLGTWGLCLLGIASWLSHSENRVQVWRSLFPLLVPSVALFLLASSQTNMNHHVRYVFPVLPAVFLIGSLASQLKWSFPLVTCLIATGVSSLLVLPHSLSFFNIAVGGSRQGHHILLDSNIDWGQDLISVERWLEEHPEARPAATLAWREFYFSRDLGIDLPRTPPGKIVPGWHLISVHLLHEPSGSYQEYLKLQPVDHVAYSLNVYHVSAEKTHPLDGASHTTQQK